MWSVCSWEMRMPSSRSSPASASASRRSVSFLPSPASTSRHVRWVSSNVALPELPDARIVTRKAIASPRPGGARRTGFVPASPQTSCEDNGKLQPPRQPGAGNGSVSGKPTQNAFIESFNGKFRDECLNQNWFVDLRDARDQIEAWRLDYNAVRPHSSLGYRTPEEFAHRAAVLRSPTAPSAPLLGPVPALLVPEGPRGATL